MAGTDESTFTGTEAIPADEDDVKTWAADYVTQQKNMMAGDQTPKPTRAEVQAVVIAHFKERNARRGRGDGIPWLRVFFWVAWILMQL